tara:strand:- start:301 stop:1131 length:831 start_codon:yes stop_codon:yes gene_type:complete
MIKVSHESPISLFEKSTEYNDYQYCLVHLMEEQPQYEEWFMEKYKAMCPDGEILLDNSIFELGIAFDSEKYIDWVRKIKPNYYIVPDVLEDAQGTMESWENFTNKYVGCPESLKIGVVQGKTWKEIVECYKFMSDKADYIAISFNFSYYQITAAGNTKLERYSRGRQYLIERLAQEGIWNYNKPHHLLGASLATEFSHYVGKYNIRTIDTSNPVVAGLLGHRYNNDLGLNFKPTQLLADLITAEPNTDQIEDIMYNTKMFKHILKRDIHTKNKNEK